MDQDRIFSLWASYLAGEATPEEIEELEWAFQANPDLRRAAELLSGTRQSPSKGSSVEQEQQMMERGLQRFKQPPLPSLSVVRRTPKTDIPHLCSPSPTFETAVLSLPISSVINLAIGNELPKENYNLTNSSDPNYFYGGDYLMRALDGVRFYNTVLTDAEILSIYTDESSL